MIQIRASFNGQIFTSEHQSWRHPENHRYHAREICNTATTLGADWAAGYIAGQRVCCIVPRRFNAELGLGDDARSEEIYAEMEKRKLI